MTSDDDVLNADIYSSQSKAEYVIASNECSYRKTSDRSPRLLSVQVSQTPGLYAGPGVYSGPGFCPKFYGKWIFFTLGPDNEWNTTG